MQINNKPIIIESIDRILSLMPGCPVIAIKRISEGVLGQPGQVEDMQIIYRDGCSETISIIEMTGAETFIKICSMIATHAALTGEGQ